MPPRTLTLILPPTSRFAASQVYHFQEPLYHFTSLRSTTHHLMFFGILLVWYFVVFEWVWCSGIYARVCAEPAYREVSFASLSTNVNMNVHLHG